MSGKRAKRARKERRRLGIEPKLDAKRRISREQTEARRLRIEAANKFRREHPEKYAAQQQAIAEQGRRALARLTAVVSAMGGL